MGQLMPILKPAGYKANDTLFFKEPLFDSSAAPVVVFGVDEGDTIIYQGAIDEADYKAKLPAMQAEALKNLGPIQPTIDFQDVGSAKIAFVMGSEYASEKILDKTFMKDLAGKIGSTSLMVGIPFKGTLIATDANAEIRLKFPVVIKNYHSDPQQEPISDKVFIVRDGEVVAMAGENIKDDAADTFVIVEHGPTNNYKVELKSRDIEEMTKDINVSFQQVILMLMDRKVFGGEVSYHIGPAMPLTEELINKCLSYVQQIDANDVAQALIHTATGSNARISFYYNNTCIAPQQETQTEEKGKWWQPWK